GLYPVRDCPDSFPVTSGAPSPLHDPYHSASAGEAVKPSVRAQLSQGLNLTPQLLQSIRLLQLTAPQLEQELRQALERNPLLEHDEDEDVGEATLDADQPGLEEAAVEAAAFDELPDPAFLSGSAGGPAGDDDGMAR